MIRGGFFFGILLGLIIFSNGVNGDDSMNLEHLTFSQCYRDCMSSYGVLSTLGLADPFKINGYLNNEYLVTCRQKCRAVTGTTKKRDAMSSVCWDIPCNDNDDCPTECFCETQGGECQDPNCGAGCNPNPNTCANNVDCKDCDFVIIWGYRHYFCNDLSQ